MSINAIINNSLTGLFTNQAALRTTSNNVANVNTPGYSRQVVRQETIVSGTLAGGVKVAGIERVVDRFLVEASYVASANFSRYESEREFHDRVQALLGRPDENSSLSGQIDSVFTAVSEVALNPLSSILRENTLSAIDRLGEEVGALSQNLQLLRRDASEQIDESIDRINSLTERIHALNPVIIKETVANGEPGSLLEQRDQALSELSELIDIRITDTGNNAVNVTTSSGINLVGVVRNEVQYNPPGTVVSSTPFPPITIHPIDPTTGTTGASIGVLDDELIGGKIRGLLNIRDKDLPEMSVQLGNFAAEFSDEINRIHNENSASPAANALVGRNVGLFATDQHNFTGEALFAVTDSAGNLVNSVNIDFGAIGPTVNDVITAVNAGLGGDATLSITNGVMSLIATNPANGVSISQTTGNPSNRGGRGFSHYFGMNDLVEARVPYHYDTGVVGTQNHNFTAGGTLNLELVNSDGLVVQDYTLTVAGTSFNDLLNDLNTSPLSVFTTFSLDANGKLTATPVPGVQETKVSVVSDTTSRGASGVSFSDFFGVGEQRVADAALDMRVRQSISDDVGLFALAKFDQTALVGQNALSIGDQSGAQALQDIETTVYQFASAGGLSEQTVTLGQYTASILADYGLRSQIAENFEIDSRALRDEISQKSSDVSGVNLDEELGNMVIYQNAYNASARLLSTAQALFDSLLNVV